jgi:hypothetical protein
MKRDSEPFCNIVGGTLPCPGLPASLSLLPAKAGCSLERQHCFGSDQTIWQQFGNNPGNVSPTWLQRCWQKGGDVTAW